MNHLFQSLPNDPNEGILYLYLQMFCLIICFDPLFHYLTNVFCIMFSDVSVYGSQESSNRKRKIDHGDDGVEESTKNYISYTNEQSMANVGEEGVLQDFVK